MHPRINVACHAEEHDAALAGWSPPATRHRDIVAMRPNRHQRGEARNVTWFRWTAPGSAGPPRVSRSGRSWSRDTLRVEAASTAVSLRSSVG